MTNNQQPTAEQLVREHLEHINSGLWNDVYGTGEDFKTIFESYLSLLETKKWWESHMGNTIPEEYRKWGCDAAKMMSEEIAELKAQLKIAKEALDYCEKMSVDDGADDASSCLYIINYASKEAISKLSI